MKRKLYSLLVALQLATISFAQIDLLKDINPGVITPGLTGGVAFNGYIYFQGGDGATGTELWRTDGTVDGAGVVKDIYPGPNASSAPSQFTIFDGYIYFAASNASGRELWRTDGTAAGTVMISDINPGSGNSNPYNLTVSNGKLFFHASTPATGNELWVSDGTAAGTTLVFDANPGTGNSTPANTTGTTIVPFNGLTYFGAVDGTPGSELWKTDGTPGGTQLVKKMYDSVDWSFIPFIVAVNSRLIFGAYNVDGANIWTSDGTPAGTVPLANMTISGAGEIYPDSDQIIGTYLYFNGNPSTDENTEVWKTDGTVVNTLQVADINGDPEVGSLPINLFAIGSVLYFAAVPTNVNVYSSSFNLYKSTGEVGNAAVIGSGYGSGYPPMNLTNYNGMLVFAGQSKFHWYDGATVNGVEAGLSGMAMYNTFVVLNDAVYFSPSGLNKFDGTTVTKIGDSYIHSSNPISFIDAGGGNAYFAADDGVNGLELWKTDGTAGGTQLVKNINPSGSTQFGEFEMYNGKVYFVANDGTEGREIWTSDGTAAGTVMISNVNAPDYSTEPHSLTVHNGSLFFPAANALWKITGDAAPEVIVENVILPPRSLTSTPDYLYFIAYNHVGQGCALYRSDGTAAGTIVASTNPASCIGPSSNTTDLMFWNSKIYYAGVNADYNSELWVYDGVTASSVKTVQSGGPTTPGNFTIVGNEMFFGAEDAVHGYELWKTDGTAENTVLVKDIWTGTNTGLYRPQQHGPPFPPYFHRTAFNGKLYFTANDGTHSFEVWVSDGTDAGTVMLNDLGPGVNSNGPMNYVVADGSLYFRAPDVDVNFNPNKVWVTNGLSCGTREVVTAPYTTSEAQYLTPIGSRLFVSLYDGRLGQEPFVIDPSQVPPPPDGCGTPPQVFSQPTTLVFSEVRSNDMTVSFTASTHPGAGYITLMRAEHSPYPDDVPVDGMSYQAGNIIGSSIVVGAGPETSWKPEGLDPETTYYFAVFTYKSDLDYLTADPLAGSQKTLRAMSQPTAIVFSDIKNKGMTISFTPSVNPGAGYITLMRTEQSPYPNDVPVDGAGYQAGNMIGASTVVNVGTETSLTLKHLDAETTYYFAVFTYYDGLDYLTTDPLSGSQRTGKKEEPEIVGIAFPDVTGNAITLSLTPSGPPADGYITLMKISSYSTDVPQDGNTYTVGGMIGTSVVVGFGDKTNLSVTSLKPETEYFFSVFPYTQTGSGYDYVMTGSLAASQETDAEGEEVITGVIVSKEERSAYPNPFTDALTIPFYTTTDNAPVHVIIYDQVGRLIADVTNTTFTTGNHEVSWDRTDSQGNKVQSGLYVYHVTTADTGKVTKGLVVAK